MFVFILLKFYTISKSGISNSGKKFLYIYTIASIKLTLVFISLVGFFAVFCLAPGKYKMFNHWTRLHSSAEVTNDQFCTLPTSCFSKVRTLENQF